MRYLIVLLAIAGVVVSGLALHVHYTTDDQPCNLNDKWDCGVVNHSPYAVMYGVPVAAIGIAGYLLIGVLSLLRQRGLLLAAAAIGFAFALYLTHIEAARAGRLVPLLRHIPRHHCGASAAHHRLVLVELAPPGCPASAVVHR